MLLVHQLPVVVFMSYIHTEQYWRQLEGFEFIIWSMVCMFETLHLLLTHEDTRWRIVPLVYLRLFHSWIISHSYEQDWPKCPCVSLVSRLFTQRSFRHEQRNLLPHRWVVCWTVGVAAQRTVRRMTLVTRFVWQPTCQDKTIFSLMVRLWRFPFYFGILSFSSFFSPSRVANCTHIHTHAYTES